MSEQNRLLERANKYIQSAKLLLEAGDYESSVSRVYYAMFFTVEVLLLSKNLSFSSHKGVISAFGEHFIKTDIFPKEMSRELNRAFEKRQLGDYDFNFIISIEEAEAILKSGNEFVEKITGYLQSLDKNNSC